eukprot:symbB.v1.2.040073.t1/scaffold6955.1/size14280/1
MHANRFSLTPRRIPAERKTPAAKSEVDQDMVGREKSVSDAVSDAESGWSGVSDNFSTHSECTDIEASSVASEQDRFDTVYDAFRDLVNGLYHIDLRRYSTGITSDDAAGVPLLDGQEKLQELVHLPRTWPLARLTTPLEGLSKQIDRLLEGYCFQILATNQNPEAHNERVLQTATHLTWILAEYLADTIAWLMRRLVVARGWSRSYMGTDALVWAFREKLIEGLFVLISMRQFTRPVLPSFNFAIEDFERVGVSVVEDADEGPIHDSA